jgi:hypothetical protein
MSADWIPFHRRLAKGPKKSIPRGVRFVLLELSLEARPTKGVIDLPTDWDTVDALHDMLGGDRREIRKALQIFSFRDSSGVPAIEIIKDALRHQCVITKWAEWAGPKSNAERQAEFKENKRLRERGRYQSVTEVTPTGEDRTRHNIREEEKSAPLHSDDVYGPLPAESEVRPASTAEEAAVASHIRSKAIFRDARWAHHVGKETASWMFGKLWLGSPEKLAWVLAAIDDAAGKCPPDASEQSKQGMVWGFIKQASKPRKPAEEPGRKEPPYRPPVWNPPKDPNAKVDFSKIGVGGIK